MNEAIYNILILGGYVAIGYVVYFGYEWFWFRYVDWYLAHGSRRIELRTNKRGEIELGQRQETFPVKLAL